MKKKEREELERLRAEQERLAEQERREELKRRKIREIRQIVHDERLWEIVGKSGLEYDIEAGGLRFIMPCGYNIHIKIKKNMPFVELEHMIDMAGRFKMFLLKYYEHFIEGRLALGYGMKLNKPLFHLRMVFNLPLQHNLVFVFPQEELGRYQSLIVKIADDTTELFVALMERCPKSAYSFALKRG